jgi:hypothetical protein
MTLEQNRNRPPEPIKGAEARAHRYLADHREERIVPLTVTYAEVIWRKERKEFLFTIQSEMVGVNANCVRLVIG